MARVAANQDQSEELQKQTCAKSTFMSLLASPGGKVMREETADYEIAPMGTETQKQLKVLTGRYWHKAKYEDFNGEPVPAAESGEPNNTRALRRCLTKKPRCPVAPPFFPPPPPG